MSIERDLVVTTLAIAAIEEIDALDNDFIFIDEYKTVRYYLHKWHQDMCEEKEKEAEA